MLGVGEGRRVYAIWERGVLHRCKRGKTMVRAEMTRFGQD